MIRVWGFRKMENIFWKILFFPDMNFEVYEREKVAKQVINPTSPSDGNTFPRRRKIALKMLLCNCFQMYINLLVAVVYFCSQYSPKEKVKNLVLELISVAHCYHLTLYVSIWHLILCRCSLKLSKLHLEMVSLVRNCSHTMTLTSMTFEYKAKWIWINFTTVTLSQSVFRQAHSASPSN